MTHNPYRYALVFYTRDGSPLDCVPVQVDWEPAAQWTRFAHIRRGRLPAVNGGGSEWIQPLWDRIAGAPYLRGFRVLIAADGSSPVESAFPLTYFGDVATQAFASLAKQRGTEAEKNWYFRVVAYLRREDDERASPVRFSGEEQVTPLPLVESSLADFVCKARPAGFLEGSDFGVFFTPNVLEEAAAMTRAADGRETGGVLIGTLHRDAAMPEIFAQVSAQIPAAHARGDAVKLTFTADTWTAVNAAIALRKRSEIYLGYWHSHPVREWCRSNECSPEKQKNCPLAKGFFSLDDKALLRAVFPRAYSLGLVVNDPAFGELTFSLFGWRDGSIEPRGFYRLEPHHA